MNVTRCGEATPISVSTRTVSALLVGSITRPKTNARNASSPRHQLSGMNAFLSDLQQRRQLVIRVSRADVLDAQHPPAPLVHDLDRDRSRRGLHPPHESAHHARLPTQPNRLSDHIGADPPKNAHVSGTLDHKIARTLQLRSELRMPRHSSFISLNSA